MPSDTISFKKIVSIFRDFTVHQKQCNYFGFGDPADFNASNDVIFPALFLEPVDATSVKGDSNYFSLNTYRFNLYCIDRINKGDSNYEFIYDTTKYILDSISAWMDTHPYYTELQLNIESINYSVLKNWSDTDCNGWVMDIEISMPNRYSSCNVSFEPITGYTVSLSSNITEYRLFGATGPQGPQGPQGFQGPTGSSGSSGAQGFQGPTGSSGSSGAQGFQGPTGSSGSSGAQGFQGPTGSSGSSGPQGFQGPTGSNGSSGAQGFQGPTGPAGSGGSLSGFTQGQVLFGNIGGTISQTASFYWDNTNGRLGLGITNSSERLTVSGSIKVTEFIYLDTAGSNTSQSPKITTVNGQFNITGANNAPGGYYGSINMTGGQRRIASFNDFSGNTALTIGNQSSSDNEIIFAGDNVQQSPGNYRAAITSGNVIRSNAGALIFTSNINLAGGFNSYTATEQMRIYATGVGIRTNANPNSFLHVNGSLSLGYVGKTQSYVLTISDYTVNFNGDNLSAILPTAVGIKGRVYNIKNSGTGSVTLYATASQTIDGTASQSLSTYDNLQVQSTDANWIII